MNIIYESNDYTVEELDQCYNLFHFVSKICCDVIVIPKDEFKQIAEVVLKPELTEAGKKIIEEGRRTCDYKKSNTTTSRVRKRSKKTGDVI